MNEEEKQAIEYLERHILPYCREGNIKFMLNDVILNLIEKQQKEIEELRNPTICGRTIDEIVNILTGLDIEKQYKIEVTMENLKSLMGIYQSEVEKSIQNAQIKIIDDLLGKGSKIEFELPHYNFDEGE